MNTTFNTQALAYSVSGTVPSGQTERADTERAFKKLDVAKKEAAAEADAQASVVSISAEGAQRSDAAQAAQASQAGQAGQAVQPAGSGQAGAAAAAPAPAPAQATAAPAAAASSTAGGVSSSTQTYDPADANRDGKVTDPERQAYDAKLAEQKAAEQAAEKAAQATRNAEAGPALKAYSTVEQLGKNSGTPA